MLDGNSLMDYVLIRDWRTKKLNEVLDSGWISVYRFELDKNDLGREFVTILPSIAPKINTQTILQKSEWEIQPTTPSPSLVLQSDEDENSFHYQRFNWEHDIEPLVLSRSYDSHVKEHLELSEEFRLYHNLFFNDATNTFIKFINGDEIEVAKIQYRNVLIKRKELLQFLAAKQYDLILYFDIQRLANFDVANIPEDQREVVIQEESIHCQYDVQKYEYFTDEYTANALFRGKVLIPCPPIERCGIYPYEEETNDYENFIIGVDDQGDNITSTCDPQSVTYSGYPFFLIPVYFTREVLKKYYDDTVRFEITDGYVGKVGSWSLHLDNNNEDYVIVFLGDLGRSLPYKEQQHWKIYNISPPSDRGFSETQIRRAFLGQWVDPTDKVFLFKSRFSSLKKTWETTYGWKLFREMHPDDAHYWDGLHRPTKDNLKELEELAIGLTKIVIESLNDIELKKRLTLPEKGEKSIKKLEKYLDQESFPEVEQHIQTLHRLYHLRTNAAAHKKDKNNYERIAKELGIDTRSNIEIADEILEGLIDFLSMLTEHIRQENK